jgi:hypothetical protein
MLEDTFPKTGWLPDGNTLIRTFSETEPGKPFGVVFLFAWKQQGKIIKFDLCFSDVVLHYESGKHSYLDRFNPRDFPTLLFKKERDRRWFIKEFERVSQNLEPEIRDFMMVELPHFAPPSAVRRLLIPVSKRIAKAWHDLFLEELPGADEQEGTK